MIKLRKEPSVVRLDKPTKPDKARMLGYKAKTGFVIARVRIGKGGRKKRQTHMGRKPSKQGYLGFTPHESLQLISEKRAGNKFPNLEVLNSYYLTEDGQHKWFEVILIDRESPSALADKEARKIISRRSRVYRGLTKAGRKIRGLI